MKIDRSFVTNLAKGKRSADFLRAVQALSAPLSLTAIAKGVETEKQLTRVRDAGIQQVQGFCLSRPLSDAAFLAFLETSDLRGHAEMPTERRAQTGTSNVVGLPRQVS